MANNISNNTYTELDLKMSCLSQPSCFYFSNTHKVATYSLDLNTDVDSLFPSLSRLVFMSPLNMQLKAFSFFFFSASNENFPSNPLIKHQFTLNCSFSCFIFFQLCFLNSCLLTTTLETFLSTDVCLFNIKIVFKWISINLVLTLIYAACKHHGSFSVANMSKKGNFF